MWSLGLRARVLEALVAGPRISTLDAFHPLVREATMILRLVLLLAALVLGSCSSMRRELSDDEWCKSFEYRAGTREYAECRQRIDRQRARAGEASRRSKMSAESVQAASADVD
jgi:hypothetical protein